VVVLVKARGHQISHCHPNQKPSSVIEHEIGEGFEAERTLAFYQDMKMVMLRMMIVMVMVAFTMIEKKGAHRRVAATTVSSKGDGNKCHEVPVLGNETRKIKHWVI